MTKEMLKALGVVLWLLLLILFWAAYKATGIITYHSISTVMVYVTFVGVLAWVANQVKPKNNSKE